MTPLEEEVKRIIRRRGPIPFRDFMAAALYHPRWGYYMRLSEIGPGGDYYTSANIHPLFGELLAEKFATLFHSLTSADRLTLVEIGAGTGQLAEDVLRALRAHHPRLCERLTYRIIEVSPRLISVQQARLQSFARVTWGRLEEFAPSSLVGIVFSHEVLDAFPVHRVVKENGRLKELYVTLQGDALVWTLGDLAVGPMPGEEAAAEASRPSNTEPETMARLAVDYLGQIAAFLDEGQIADIALDIIPWLRSVTRLLAEGYLVTIDYGDAARPLYAPYRREGTLRCFFRHTLVSDPLIRIGDQDITASVDFTLLMEMGKRFGLETVEFTSLGQFLRDLGLLDRVERLTQTARAPEASLRERLALKHFLLPGAFGENFKVLVQRCEKKQRQASVCDV